MKQLVNLPRGILLLILVLVVIFPNVSPSSYLTHIMVLILIFSSITTAWSYKGLYGTLIEIVRKKRMITKEERWKLDK
ncbi:hypothetical protein ES703_117346 [subsurface metagenome]